MKRIFYFMMAVALLCGCAKDDKDVEKPGGIYGVITDKATGEPIQAAGVQLNPLGTKTVTGNEGQYEFTELKAGEYTLQVTKTGYTELLNHKITVVSGKTNKGDVQIEKLPAALKVVNSNAQEIDSLSFGSETSVVTRSFSIFNDGPESLKWVITENCDWITELNETNGTLQAGKQHPIIVTIDREKLGAGENTYILNISSDNGSKELTINAIGIEKGLATLNTLEVSNISATAATFNGEITAAGSPAYTERGFVYSTLSMPTVETAIVKLTVMVTDNNFYSAHATGLTLNQKYYVRAYAINSEGIAYSTNEESFTTTAVMPTLTTQAVTNINIAAGTATFNGTILTVGDPAYTEKGFVYGTTRNPSIDDATKITVSGTGTGVFSLSITGLTIDQTYYIRAYATNAKEPVYGEEVSFVLVATAPVLSTQAVTNRNVAAGTATFNGTIVSVGDLPIVERGFVYGTLSKPTIEDDMKKTVAGSGTTLSTNVSGLTGGAVYYVHSYATTAKETVYSSNEESVDFNYLMPQVATQVPTNVLQTSVTLNGNAVSAGDHEIMERGFVYSINENPTISDTRKSVTGNNLGAFYISATDLTANTMYYVRAYVQYSEGIIYGNQINFRTLSNNVYVLEVMGLMVQKTDANASTVVWSVANSLCKNSIVDDYTDWRLPTKDELATLYNERNTIGGFTTSGSSPYYWSSTAYSSYYWFQDFSSGAQTDSGSYYYYDIRCRCVRDY